MSICFLLKPLGVVELFLDILDLYKFEYLAWSLLHLAMYYYHLYLNLHYHDSVILHCDAEEISYLSNFSYTCFMLHFYLLFLALSISSGWPKCWLPCCSVIEHNVRLSSYHVTYLCLGETPRLSLLFPGMEKSGSEASSVSEQEWYECLHSLSSVMISYWKSCFTSEYLLETPLHTMVTAISWFMILFRTLMNDRNIMSQHTNSSKIV
jgi:hypothetical protein